MRNQGRRQKAKGRNAAADRLRVLLPFAFCLLPSAFSRAADPQVKLDGPTEAVAGGVAEFRFALDNVKKWIVDVDPAPEGLKSFVDHGQGVIWLHARKPASYALRLTASSPDGGLGEQKVRVKFLAPLNDTPVVPAGPPTAAEHLSDHEQPLDTRSLAQKLAKGIDTDNPRKEAQLVADVLRAARGEVTAQRIETPEELVRYTAKGCANKLGAESWLSWKADFFGPFQEHLDGLAASGQLTVMQNYEDTWLEAAKGLERFTGR